jgi:hypothetical protein
MKRRTRNFRLEYQHRKERSLARGLSLARARGHISVKDIKRAIPIVPDPNDAREKALQELKIGVSQKAAANKHGVSVERLRRYVRENTSASFKHKKWVIVDRRPALMLIASRGKIYFIPVSYRSRSRVGKYWNAVNKFLGTNDATYLKRYVGKGIRDAEKHFHPWETDPNVLRKLDSIGDFDFTEIYHNVLQ